VEVIREVNPTGFTNPVSHFFPPVNNILKCIIAQLYGYFEECQVFIEEVSEKTRNPCNHESDEYLRRALILKYQRISF